MASDQSTDINYASAVMNQRKRFITKLVIFNLIIFFIYFVAGLYIGNYGEFFIIAILSMMMFTLVMVYLYQDLVKTTENLINERNKQTAEIMQQKIAEQTREAREGETLLLASINSFDVGYIMTNHQPALVLINQAAFIILAKAKLIDGIPFETHSQRAFSLNDLANQMGDQAKLLERVKECLSSKKTVFINDIVYNNVFLQFFISPIIFNKNVVGTVILMQDVTEERVLDRSKDELFSIASHELRTPLAAIRGYSSLIEKRYKKILVDPKLKSMIQGIHSSSIRLIDIVGDFLDTSKLEQKRIIFNYTMFDISEIASEIAKEYSNLAQEKKLKLVYENPEQSIEPAYADKERVKQVLINLISNAIKFTEKGSITITVFKEDTNVGIRVQDTGKGILPENQKLLFRKFQQAGNDIITRDASRGTGLGLYISKLLLESMRGNIQLEQSEVGKGSTFAFTVPIAPIVKTANS